MRTIVGRNVNSLYRKGTKLLITEGKLENSRVGTVLVTDFPVVSICTRPAERVLWDSKRDANPFFHFFESLWMLAGRNDGAWLDRFVHDFSSRFAEPGTDRMHGAYGYRWRRSYDLDQLTAVVNRLRQSSSDRRSVIAMWDVDLDLYDPKELNEDTGRPFEEPRDIPCNTHVYPRVVNNALDLTVCCRSNDAIWGAYGSNIVHFSFLQEYLASSIGVRVGVLRQLSNNFHMYTNVADEKLRRNGAPPNLDPYVTGEVSTLSIAENPKTWLSDLDKFMDNPGKKLGRLNRWFDEVAVPMWQCFDMWKSDGKWSCVDHTDNVLSSDWRLASRRWLSRRVKNPQTESKL